MQDTNDHDLSLIAQEVNRIISRETDAQARRKILTRGRGVGEMTQRLAIILDFIDQTVRSRFRGFDSNVEPDFGEVNYAYVLEQLDATGYSGWVGCEYRPKAGTREGLGWARPYGITV